ncbi:MAG: PEP-CTERM sorting domain-containing protein [Alphaproteobacteria bacterium]|nr:PEP-CTERM sorting domain-containing protein [Alphaproteobacteria bacterium]
MSTIASLVFNGIVTFSNLAGSNLTPGQNVSLTAQYDLSAPDGNPSNPNAGEFRPHGVLLDAGNLQLVTFAGQTIIFNNQGLDAYTVGVNPGDFVDPAYSAGAQVLDFTQTLLDNDTIPGLANLNTGNFDPSSQIVISGPGGTSLTATLNRVSYSEQPDSTPTPEPGTLGLVGLAAAVLGAGSRRLRNALLPRGPATQTLDL